MQDEDLVLHYQLNNTPDDLLEKYDQFLRKYVRLLSKGSVDFANYDTRRFIACFISDKEVVTNLCSAEEKTEETRNQVYEVVGTLRGLFRKNTPCELYNELVILFLEAARDYKEVGSDFSHYLYSVFRYKVKRMIDSRMHDCLDEGYAEYRDRFYSDDDRGIDTIIENTYYHDPLNIRVNEFDELEDNVLWLNGVSCSDLFKQLSYTERYVLVQAYEKGLSDKEIARVNGLHHRSIYRIRRRLIEYFREKRIEGAIKWLR